MYIEINTIENKFEVGKVYNIKNKDIKIYNCFNDIPNNSCINKYYLKIKSLKNKDKILIQKELNINDFLLLNVSSEWLINYIKSKLKTEKRYEIKSELFEEIIPFIINKDLTGQSCYELATLSSIFGFSIKKLIKAIIQKDKTGEWCSKIAIIASNINLISNSTLLDLEERINEKDKIGFWIDCFNKIVKNNILNENNININLILENIKKGYSGYGYI